MIISFVVGFVLGMAIFLYLVKRYKDTINVLLFEKELLINREIQREVARKEKYNTLYGPDNDLCQECKYGE
jgi:hypothetical protein